MKSILSVDLDWILEHRQAISVVTLLIEKFKSCDKIIFVKEHHQVLKHLDGTEDTIYNVDHHHDLGYDDFQRYDDIEKNIEFREGDWIQFLLKSKSLKNYVWIHNISSLLADTTLTGIRELEQYNHTIDLNVCENVNFSKVVICESYEYSNTLSPFMYNILLEICKSIHKEKLVIDNAKNIASYVDARIKNF
jgi:hypothetical protein|tara:strand:+ start:2000 stop:2575 length:576 start_codon:yes stop_codon:yes gene_type:complete